MLVCIYFMGAFLVVSQLLECQWETRVEMLSLNHVCVNLFSMTNEKESLGKPGRLGCRKEVVCDY